MSSIGNHVKRHSYSPQDNLFFDANIWIHIFGPQASPDDSRVKSYSTALKRARNAGSVIHIDVVVLGEFLNRSLRFHFDQAGKPGGDFKKYRSTPEYAAAVRDVSSQAQTIVGLCHTVESDFTQCDLPQLLTRFGQSQSDFSDEIIVELCRRHNFTLVTDDGDFLESGLKILSCNSVYL